VSSSATTVPVNLDVDGDVAARTPGYLRRLFRRPLAIACILYLLGLVGLAIFAPMLLPHAQHDRIGDLLRVHQGPSRRNLLGTDTLGRDVLNRLLVGTRIQLISVFEAVTVGAVVGLPLGLVAGYFGGRSDRFLSWLTDLSFSIPSIMIILVVAVILPQNLLAMMVTFGLLTAPGVARVVRAVTLPIREELYISAARVSGLSQRYIIARHVFPRVAGVVIVQVSFMAAGSVGITAGLAFLGVLSSTVPTWGGMVQDGISVLQIQPWLIWPPGVAIGVTVLAFALLGDALRDVTAETWSSPAKKKRVVRAAPVPLEEHHSARDRSLLRVEHLSVGFPAADGVTRVVDDVSFDVAASESVGIVGESGCGKTMTAMAVLGLIPGEGQIEAGRIMYDGVDLAAAPERILRRFRGNEIGLISQEPTVSLTPTFRVGWQIAEAVRTHHRVSRKAARARTIDLLKQVQLPEPELVARRYVHELSGGMAQRVAIARALAGEPRLLIADEPTTALDVTVQAEILDLLRDLVKDRQMALLVITHDWGVIADICDRAIVMYAGQVVEQADLVPMFREPLHPYTRALLASNPHHAVGADELPTIPGAVPAPGSWPCGCRFHPRCHFATNACVAAPIPLEHPGPARDTRCIHYDRLAVSA
jgi:peptide/nickel transport system permease protein